MQWNQLDRMQTICTSLQTNSHTITSSLNFYLPDALFDAQPTVSKHIHTHTFNSPFSGTTKVSQYQKGKTYLDFTEARDSEWQWHQLGHMQVCISLQTDNRVSTSPLSFFRCRMPFLQPNQQHQNTEGIWHTIRYDTRCYFNVRSKADISQLNLPHGTDN